MVVKYCIGVWRSGACIVVLFVCAIHSLFPRRKGNKGTL
jgi:hypothetical protein